MKNLESKIKKFLDERKWNHLLPADLAKSIMIEGAELLELFQWNNQSIEETKRNKSKMEEIKKELADVMIYALDLSVSLGLDTEKIILDKLKLVEHKYPAKLMRKNKVKPGNQKIYLEIKKKYRKMSQN